MTHDPYQMHQMTGAYPGINNPFTSPFATQGLNPLAAMQGGWGGVNPLQTQLASGLGQQINPLLAVALQNPYVAAAVQNPLLNPVLAQQIAALAYSQFTQPFGQQQYQQPFGQQQYLQPLAQYQQPFGQQYQQPFGQQYQQPFPQLGHANPAFGQQFVNPLISSQLAPQSWVGQGLGQQINPLILQAAARTIPNQGINPWASF